MSKVRIGRALVAACVASGMLSAEAGAAAGWGKATPVTTGKKLSQLVVDDAGRGVFVSGDALVSVAANGEADAAFGLDGVGGSLVVAVSPNGRLAVASLTGGDGVGSGDGISLGFGTTRRPPTAVRPYVRAGDGRTIYGEPHLAIGRDGRVLLTWAESPNGGVADFVKVARQAPGEGGPRVEEVEAYVSTEPHNLSVTDAVLDNGARPFVSWNLSERIGGNTRSARQAASPDGAFRKKFASRSLMFSGLFLHEGTGSSSLFFNRGGTALGKRQRIVAQRVTPAGRFDRPRRLATIDDYRWSAAVGRNGAAAMSWLRRGVVRIVRRSQSGNWLSRREVLGRVGRRSGAPSVAVDELAGVVAAVSSRRKSGARRVLATYARPGQRLGALRPIRGGRGCGRVQIAGAGSGRALAVLRCGSRPPRIAAFAP